MAKRQQHQTDGQTGQTPQQDSGSCTISQGSHMAVLLRQGAWRQSSQAWGGSSHPSKRLPVSVGDAITSRVSKRTVKTRTLTQLLTSEQEQAGTRTHMGKLQVTVSHDVQFNPTGTSQMGTGALASPWPMRL